MVKCTWEKVDGKWKCKATKCTHWKADGICAIGKVSLTCDNNDCKWNIQIEGYGIYVCSSMDIHLDAEGKCLSIEIL